MTTETDQSTKKKTNDAVGVWSVLLVALIWGGWKFGLPLLQKPFVLGCGFPHGSTELHVSPRKKTVFQTGGIYTIHPAKFSDNTIEWTYSKEELRILFPRQDEKTLRPLRWTLDRRSGSVTREEFDGMWKPFDSGYCELLKDAKYRDSDEPQDSNTRKF